MLCPRSVNSRSTKKMSTQKPFEYNERSLKKGHSNSSLCDRNRTLLLNTPIKGVGKSLQAQNTKRDFQHHEGTDYSQKDNLVSTLNSTNKSDHGYSQTTRKNHVEIKSSERCVSSLQTHRTDTSRLLQSDKTHKTPSRRKRKAQAVVVSPSQVTESPTEKDCDISDSAQCPPPKYLSLKDVQSIFSRFDHCEPPSENLPFKVILVPPPPIGSKISPPTRRFEDGIYILLHATNRKSDQTKSSDTYQILSDEDLELLPKSTWRVSGRPLQVEKSNVISRKVQTSNTCDKEGTIYTICGFSPGGTREEDLSVRIFHIFTARIRFYETAESPGKRMKIYSEKQNEKALRERYSYQNPAINEGGQFVRKANGLKKSRNENNLTHATTDATKCIRSDRQCEKDFGNNKTEISSTIAKISEISTPSSLGVIYNPAQNIDPGCNWHELGLDVSLTESMLTNQTCIYSRMPSSLSKFDSRGEHVSNPPQPIVTEVDHTKRLSAEDVKAIFDSVLENTMPPPIHFRIIIASHDDVSFIPPPFTLLDGVYVILRSQKKDIVRLPTGFQDKLFAPTSKIHPCSWRSSGKVRNENKFQKRRWLPKDCCSNYSACRRGELWTMRSSENAKYEVECRVFQVYFFSPWTQRKVRKKSFETSCPGSGNKFRPVPNRKCAPFPQSDEVAIMGLRSGDALSSSAPKSLRRSSRISDDEIRSIVQCVVENCTSPIEFKIIVVDPNDLSVSPPPYEFDVDVYVLLSSENRARVSVPTQLANKRMKESDIKSLPFCKWTTSGPHRAKNSEFLVRHCSPAQRNINPKRGIIWHMIDENRIETASCRILQIYRSFCSNGRCIRSLNSLARHGGPAQRGELESNPDHLFYAISNVACLELRQSMAQLIDRFLLTPTKSSHETNTSHDGEEKYPICIVCQSYSDYDESDDETRSLNEEVQSLLSTNFDLASNGETLTPRSEHFSNATNILHEKDDSIVANLSFNGMHRKGSASATSFHSINGQESVPNIVCDSSTDVTSMKESQHSTPKCEGSPTGTTLDYTDNSALRLRHKLFLILLTFITVFGRRLFISAFLFICVAIGVTTFALVAFLRIKTLEKELERAKELHLRQIEALENHHTAEIQLCEKEHDEFVSNLIQSHKEEFVSLQNLMVLYQEASVDTFQMFRNSEA